MKLREVKVDADLAEKGVLCPFGEPVDDKQAAFLVGYAGNKAYNDKLASLTRRAAQQIPGRELPMPTILKLRKEAMVGTVLLGWENFEEDDGTPIEPEKDGKPNEAAFKQFLDIPVTLGFIENQSLRLENFQREKKAASDAAIKSRA